MSLALIPSGDPRGVKRSKVKDKLEMENTGICNTHPGVADSSANPSSQSDSGGSHLLLSNAEVKGAAKQSVVNPGTSSSTM